MNFKNIFNQNLVIGFKVGEGVIISGIITNLLRIPITKFTFINRLTDASVFNLLYNDYGVSIPFWNSNNYFSNPLYRGAFQTVKWVPNFWIQNYLKAHYPSLPYKEFLFPFIGMTTFFSIGAIEDSLKEQPFLKLGFTTVSAISLSYSLYTNNTNSTFITDSGSINLSTKDTLLAGTGFIGSFLTLDLLHVLGLSHRLPNIAGLDHLTIGFMAVEISHNLANSKTFESILWQQTENVIKIAAFSLAKATAVTTFTFLSTLTIPTLITIGSLGYEAYKTYDLINNGNSTQEVLLSVAGDVSSLVLFSLSS